MAKNTAKGAANAVKYKCIICQKTLKITTVYEILDAISHHYHHKKEALLGIETLKTLLENHSDIKNLKNFVDDTLHRIESFFEASQNKDYRLKNNSNLKNIENSKDDQSEFQDEKVMKPYSCSICHEAFGKLNSLGNHVETVHILKNSSENIHENHSNPKNIDNFIVDQSEPDCEKIRNHSDQERIEKSVVDQSESDCEKIPNDSHPKNIENSIHDQSDLNSDQSDSNSDHSELEKSRNDVLMSWKENINQKIETLEGFRCHHCKAVFNTEKALNVHNKVEHSKL